MVRIENFWMKVEKSEGCWIWKGSTFSNGYGRFRVGKRRALSHRFSYQQLVGPIPEGLTIDHLCKNRLCVNPQHMEVVTRGENCLRGNSPAALEARQTHCKNGHTLEGENLDAASLRNGRRICSTCLKAYRAIYEHSPERKRRRNERGRRDYKLGRG